MDISFACGAVRSLAGSLRGQRNRQVLLHPCTHAECLRPDGEIAKRDLDWIGAAVVYVRGVPLVEGSYMERHGHLGAGVCCPRSSRAQRQRPKSQPFESLRQRSRREQSPARLLHRKSQRSEDQAAVHHCAKAAACIYLVACVTATRGLGKQTGACAVESFASRCVALAQ